VEDELGCFDHEIGVDCSLFTCSSVELAVPKKQHAASFIRQQGTRYAWGQY